MPLLTSIPCAARPFCPSSFAPPLLRGLKVTYAAAVPPRLIVATDPSPSVSVQTPSSTMTTSPGFTRLAALSIVRNGALSVPEFESEPLGETKYVPTTGVEGVTVIAELPLCPSLVAVIVAAPTATAVTRPLPFTVATPVLLLDHVTVRPVKTFPLASRSVADSWRVPPTVSVAVAGETLTVVTGGRFTVIDDVPLTPSLVAVMVAEPAPAPVTSPVDDTVATPLAFVVQVTVRPVSTFPLASRGVAVS